MTCWCTSKPCNLWSNVNTLVCEKLPCIGTFGYSAGDSRLCKLWVIWHGLPGTHLFLCIRSSSTDCKLIFFSLAEPSRLQIRRRRSSISLSHQRRPARASPQTRPRNHRSRQRPLLLQEPRRLLRMSALSHSTSERWLLSRPHTRSQTSDEPG